MLYREWLDFEANERVKALLRENIIPLQKASFIKGWFMAAIHEGYVRKEKEINGTEKRE